MVKFRFETVSVLGIAAESGRDELPHSELFIQNTLARQVVVPITSRLPVVASAD